MAITYHAGRRIQGTSTTSVNYKVHTFLLANAGTDFEITNGSGNVDTLIVAGGGGGGGNHGGGGGSGGVIFKTNHPVTANTAYTVTVGNGGTGGVNTGANSGLRGSTGSDSSFDSLVAKGGGSAGSYASDKNGGNGGSAGGLQGSGSAGTAIQTTQSGDSGTYGFGGASSSSVGGGAGSSSGSGIGGTINSDINNILIQASAGVLDGTDRYIAGGGTNSASVQQLGGGGLYMVDGIDGTGSGGGGGCAGSCGDGGDGGNGIILIRYLDDGSITATGGSVTTEPLVIPITKPTNVQAGSRFEETDTRKMYHRFGETADVSGTDLKVYWKFNDASGSIVNSAGNVTGNSTLGSDADLAILGTGTPVYKQESPSGISKSVEFGQTATSPNFGQGQYARTASNLSQFSFMCTGTPQFTVCFWAKSSSNTFVNNQNLLGDNMGDTTRGFKIYWIGYPDGDNYMTTSMTKTGGGNDQPIRGTSPAQFWVADGAWHFYVFTIDFSLGSNQGYMSRDISGSTYSYSKNTPTPDSSGDTSYPMNFRNDAPNNGYGVPPTTQYAEFSIWDRVLTSAEISKLYNSGNGAQLDNRWDEEGT